MFLEKLQGLHPLIKFTVEIDPKQLPFLDVLVLKQDNEIQTDIFHKITDTFNYLHFKSAHPRSTKRNIPFNLAQRIKMIVSDKHTRHIRYSELVNRLETKGYPRELILKAIDEVENKTLEPRNQSEKNVISFTFTFNLNIPDFGNIIKNSLSYLNADEKMAEVLSNSQIIYSKRQPPN